MKLFIWNEPYKVEYGGACLYVIAETLEQARELALNAQLAYFGLKPLGTVGIPDLGEPDRVLDAPYAECYEWYE